MGRPNVNWNVGIAAEKQSTYTSKTLKAGIPFASQVTEPNTKYIIKYDFGLEGETVEMPEDCIFEFDGGKIKNGTITGNNTYINWNGAVIFGSDIIIAGTWSCPVISTKMFSDLSADNALRKLEALNTDDIQTSMYIEKESYDYYFSLPGQYESGININSNTDIYLDGTIKCKANSNFYQIINIVGKKNINIAGSGSVIGDRDIHTTTTGEWGHCVGIFGADNINISGITISKAWGDGICVGMNTSVTPNLHCSGVSITSCEIFDCRRQGITIGGGDRILIDRCYIHDIEGTKPEHCIDIEPNNASHYLNNIVISNCRMKGKRLFLAPYSNTTAKNVVVDNCYFESTATDATYSAPIDTRTGSLRIVFQNNHFTYSEGRLNFFRNSEGAVFSNNVIEFYAGMAINGGEFVNNKIKYLPSERTTASFGSLYAQLKMYDNEITILPNTESPSFYSDTLLRGTYDIDFNRNKVYKEGGLVLDFNLTTQSYKNLLRSRNYFSTVWTRTVGAVYFSEDGFPKAETTNLPTGDILFDGLCIYDITRNKPLWYRGSTLGWVDATGNEIDTETT